MPGRWLAATICGLIDEEGDLALWVMNCTSTNPRFCHHKTEVKFFAGTDDGHPEDVNILGTQKREFTEESDLIVGEQTPVRLIHSYYVSRHHFRSFYFVWFDQCVGRIRAVEKIVGFDKMSKPYLVKAKLLRDRLYPTHRPGLDALLESESLQRLMKRSIAV